MHRRYKPPRTLRVIALHCQTAARSDALFLSRMKAEAVRSEESYARSAEAA